MFGMGFFELVVIAIVAVIFLGPDKLPQAIVDVVKLLRVMRKTIHDAKQTLNNELQLSELQKEAAGYKQQFAAQVDSITKDIQLQEVGEEVRGDIQGVQAEVSHIFTEYQSLPALSAASSEDSRKDSSARESALESKAPAPINPPLIEQEVRQAIKQNPEQATEQKAGQQAGRERESGREIEQAIKPESTSSTPLHSPKPSGTPRYS